MSTTTVCIAPAVGHALNAHILEVFALECRLPRRGSARFKRPLIPLTVQVVDPDWPRAGIEGSLGMDQCTALKSKHSKEHEAAVRSGSQYTNVIRD